MWDGFSTRPPPKAAAVVRYYPSQLLAEEALQPVAVRRAERDRLVALQDDGKRAVGAGHELAHAVDVHDGAAVHAHEQRGIELRLEVLQRLADQKRTIRG